MSQIHLDEHVNPAIADGLRRCGIDVTTSAGAGLLGATDPDQVAFAVAQGRVIVTNDDDFLRLHDREGTHAGIAYCRQQRHSVGEIVRALELIWEVLDPDEMQNRIEFV